MPSRPTFSHRLPQFLPPVLLCVLLAGCAAQTAYREGKNLISEDKVEQGLQKLQEAVRLEPQDARYKSTFLQARDRSIQALLEKAERALEKGEPAEADKLYHRILGFDGNNERAKAGIQAIKQEQRHRQLLAEVTALVEKKDIPAAQVKLRTILIENPRHSEALALRTSLIEKNTPPPVESRLASTYKKPINIEFKDATLKQVFDIISRSSGLNFIFDRDVRLDQKTSLFLKNSNVENAVYYTLLANQLDQQILDANTIMIFPNTPVKQKDYQEIHVKSFFLGNSQAKTLANTIKTILKTRDVAIDEKLNMLIIRDSLEGIRQAEKLITMHDVPEPEVMLEVEVLEVNRSSLLNLGINWPSLLSLQPLSLGTTGSTGTGTGTTAGTSSLRLSDLRGITSRSLGATISPLTVNAEKTDSDANLLANPRIRVRNQEKAKIHIGERLPSVTTTTNGGIVTEQINYIEVGLKLDVQPTIYLDNDVAIDVNMEVSSIVGLDKSNNGNPLYTIGSRTAKTILRLKDGETQVLAGLIKDEDRRSAKKVPGLGELPVLDRLFGSANDENEKTEIILSITPRLIRNIQRPDAAVSEFRAGTDSTTRQRPESAGGLSAPPVPSRSATPGTQLLPPTDQPTKPVDSGSGSNINNINNINNSNIGTNFQASNPGNVNPGGTVQPPIVVDSTGGVSNPTKLFFQGQQKAAVGDTFLVQVTMSSDQVITSLPIAIGFDNKTLQVVGITEGNFLKQGGAQTNFSTRIDPNGQILMTGTRSGGSGPTAAADVANITFRAIAPMTDSKVQILTVAPVTIQGRSLAVQLPPPHLVLISPAAN